MRDRACPIGMLEMIDGGDRDEKLLCVPDKDPRYAHYKSLKDVAPHRLDEIAEFFRTYKNLEKKVTEILGWQRCRSSNAVSGKVHRSPSQISP